MDLPNIAVFNFSDKSDVDVQRAVRAVNRQVIEDFLPAWGSAYVCRLHNLSPSSSSPSEFEDERVSADAALYVVDQGHLPGAAGYHARNAAEVPFGFVFTESNEWTVTFSHEVLELMVDPHVNAYAPGPDPRPGQDGVVLHAYEVCDAVERYSYLIDGIAVSNFLTPQYFSPGDAPNTRNDFLGVGVPSFGVMPGCHLGFIDLSSGYVQYARPFAAAQALASLPSGRARGLEPTLLEKERIPEEIADAVMEIAKRSDGPVARFIRHSVRRNAYRESAENLLAGGYRATR